MSLEFGYYSNGREKIKISQIKNEKEVEVFAVSNFNFLNLKSGERTKIRRDSFVSFLTDDLSDFKRVEE